MVDLVAAVVGGRVRPPPERAAVPPWIRAILLRGLSPQPSARYETLGELLRALEQEPGSRRRRVMGTVAVLSALGVAGFWAERMTHAGQVQVCSGGAQEAAEVWNADLGAEVERAFASTGAPFAADALRRTRDALDGYTRRWTDAHRQTCEATRVHKAQSETLMTLRMACLEQDRAQMRALVHVFATADKDTVEKAVQAAKGLPSVDACSDVTSLMEVQPLPDEPALRAPIEAVRDSLATVRAQLDAGRYKSVRAQMQDLIAQPRELHYEPLIAQTLYVLGAAQHSSDAPQAAAATLREAVWTAERGRDDDTKVRALLRLASVDVTLSRFDDAALWLDFAAASVARHPGDELLEARYNLTVATRLYILGRYAEAAPYARRATSLADGANLDDGLTRWEAYFRLGSVLMSTASTEGLEDLERADRLLVDSLGPSHPQRVRVAGNRCVALSLLGRDEECVALAHEMLPIAKESLAPDHRWTGILYGRLGESLYGLARYPEALDVIDETIAISHAAHDDRELGDALTIRGNALSGLNRWRDAMKAYNEALQALSQSVPEGHDFVAAALKGRGRAELHLGDPRAAQADLEQAVSVFSKSESSGDGKLELAEGRFALAEALWTLGERTGTHRRSGGRRPRRVRGHAPRHPGARGRRLAVAARRAAPGVDDVVTAVTPSWRRRRSCTACRP